MDLVPLLVILVLAHSAETVLGFGATIIALSLGAHLYPLSTLLPVLVILALAQSAWLVGRWRRHIRWRLLLVRILPAAAAGTALGIAMRSLADERLLVAVLGSFVSAVSLAEIAMIIRKRTSGAALPSWLGIPILAAGGVFHGLFATGGPLVVYFASREIDDPPAFRATLSTLWLGLNTALAASLAWSGQADASSLRTAGLVLPGLVAGIAIGSRIRLEALAFKVCVYALLLASGLALVTRALLVGAGGPG